MNESNNMGGTEPDDIDAIYQAPESDSIPPGDEDLLGIFVGPKNSHYYAHAFGKFAAGSNVKWNWPAFFITLPWLLYRKMWLYSLGYLFGIPIVFSIIELILVSPAVGGGTLYVIFSFVLVPMFATRLYYKHARNKIGNIKARTHSVEEQRFEIARAGSTSIIGVIVVVILLVVPAVVGIIAAISIPAYQGYTVRAQVSEGLNISGGAKAAVAKYFYENNQFPLDNATVGLSPATEIQGRYVSSVKIETGNITVTYGNQADRSINGKSLVLRPENMGQTVSWACINSDDIKPNVLPTACRSIL